MDGVIYHGDQLLPNVKKFIDWLERENKNFLFLQLQTHLTFLIVEIAAAGPRGNTARDQLCCSFRNEKYAVSFLCIRILNPAHRCSFSGTRSTGDNDF